MVEDPGALNFLAPLVDMLIEQDVSLVIFGVGVGAHQLSERGIQVVKPPSEQDAEKILRAYGCYLLIIGTCEDKHTPAFDLVRAARLAGIQTLGVVDAANNAQFRFRGSRDVPLAHAPDWMIVPDEATAEAFDQLGFPRNRIIVVGHPARDLARRQAQEWRSERMINESCNSQRNWRIVFVSEISDGLDRGQYTLSSEYSLLGRGSSYKRTSIVAEELLDSVRLLSATHGIDFELVLRLHPKQTRSDLGVLCDEFDEVSIGGDPLAVVRSADLVVGMTSMLLLQAHDMGLQCLAILPRVQEKNWLAELSDEAIPCVTTREELHAILKVFIVDNYRFSIKSPENDVNNQSISKMVEFVLGCVRS